MGSVEHGNEPLDFIKNGEFIDLLRTINLGERPFTIDFVSGTYYVDCSSIFIDGSVACRL